ncbi:MAG TPA: type I 3-dehydroquinate dehydratase [Thermoanaerobaculia bacterium]|nr:type I 3-dehydroquinate dehydratase [Thermoanaerobaculia bacterium]
MARVVLTIWEASAAKALELAARLGTDADAVEIRVDRFSAPGEPVDFGAFRRATARPLILTRRAPRGRAGAPHPIDVAEVRRALEAGFDLVDIELAPDLDPRFLAPFLDRTILSHHDFDGVPDLGPLLRRMQGFGAAEIKIAATPRSFGDNLRLLALLDGRRGELTVIGMGEMGLYARILAPFFGSSLAFVGASAERAAAPGQFDLDRARAIWGDAKELRRPEAIFAVVGRPAAHSESPRIHNRRFREGGLSAAYAIAEVESFGEIAETMLRGERLAPRGVSITAPFKQEAYRIAKEQGARVRDRAEACGAINTLVRMPDGGLVADNTDVEGIGAVVDGAGRGARRAAVVGSGGTARAAIVALRAREIEVEVFARSPDALDGFRERFAVSVAPLEALPRFDGDLLVDATSADAMVAYPPSVLREGGVVIDAAYTPERRRRLDQARAAGAAVTGGLELLEAQAIPQSELFFAAMAGKVKDQE